MAHARSQQTAFGTTLERHALGADAGIALVLAEREVTYAELLRRARTCAAWLASQRLVATESVGLTIADEFAHIVASFALLLLGVPQVTLPTHDPAAKRAALAERLGVRCVVAADARHALPGLELLLLTPERARDGDGAPPEPIAIDEDAPAVYYASSGATGDPKLFALSQRATAWRALSIAESERIAPGYRSLSFVPVEDSMAKSRMLTCAHLGFASILPGRQALSSVADICSRYRATCLELTILQATSLASDGVNVRPLPRHTTVYVTGAMVPGALRRKLEGRLGVPIFVHYGAREFGRISSTFPGNGRTDFDSVGAPVPWIDLEIVDAEGNALPTGTVGELRVRSECMSHEYYGDPAATARHFKDGWFYPKDLGCLEGGVLRLYGRADDMMNLNGIKIFPAEIERVLEEHPAVKAAAAFARPSPAHGDIPLAAVELHDSVAVAAEELMARARERLGARAPRRIIVLDALPRNASGKVIKRELLELVAASG